MHVDKYHSVTVNLACNDCDFVTQSDEQLNQHTREKHVKKRIIKTEECMDIDAEDVVEDKNGLIQNENDKKEVIRVIEENDSYLRSKISQLQEALETLENEHTKVVGECSVLKVTRDTLKKDNMKESKEMNLLKQENEKLITEITSLQEKYNKLEAKVKADERSKKIKENTVLKRKVLLGKLLILIFPNT